MVRPLATFVLALTLLAVGGSARALQGDCRKCRGEAVLPCPEHKKVVDLEEGVLYCSALDGCEDCFGVGWVDCPKCYSPESEASLEQRRAKVVAHREALGEIDAEMERAVPKVETAHFVLVWDVESMKVGKKRLDGHELIHLYAERLERLFTDYREHLGAEEEDFERKSRVFVWALSSDQLRASLRFCSIGMEGAVKLMGADPNYSVLGSRREFDSDEALHRHVAHSVTHLLMSHQRPSQWIGNLKGGWADAGLAHWFENEYFGVCDVYCYQEQDIPSDFEGGRWPVLVRKLVSGDESPPAAGVFAKNVDTLTGAEHMVAFSYMDYLLQLDGRKVNALLKRLREKVPTRDALEEVFGTSVFEFEASWKQWVLDTYPTR